MRDDLWIFIFIILVVLWFGGLTWLAISQMNRGIADCTHKCELFEYKFYKVNNIALQPDMCKCLTKDKEIVEIEK